MKTVIWAVAACSATIVAVLGFIKGDLLQGFVWGGIGLLDLVLVYMTRED